MRAALLNDGGSSSNSESIELMQQSRQRGNTPPSGISRYTATATTNGTGANGNANAYQQRLHQEQVNNMYLESNEQLLLAIERKVADLRQVSINIGTEAKSQSALLDELDDSFRTAGNALSNTVKKLKHMTEVGGSSYMCHLVLFIFFLFMFLYFFVRRK